MSLGPQNLASFLMPLFFNSVTSATDNEGGLSSKESFNLVCKCSTVLYVRRRASVEGFFGGILMVGGAIIEKIEESGQQSGFSPDSAVQSWQRTHIVTSRATLFPVPNERKTKHGQRQGRRSADQLSTCPHSKYNVLEPQSTEEISRVGKSQTRVPRQRPETVESLSDR